MQFLRGAAAKATRAATGRPREGDRSHLSRPVAGFRADHVGRVNMDQTLQGFASSLRSLPMPELRKDPIVGRWVIIATDRAKRPVAPKTEPLPPGGASARSARAARTRRRTRSSPIATATPGPTRRAGASASCPTSSPPCRSRATCSKRGDGIYDKMNGIGAHEVIIECPFHEVTHGQPRRRTTSARCSGSTATAWSI